MSLNGVSGQSYFYERMNAGSRKGRKAQDNQRDAFSGNLKEMLKDPEEGMAEADGGVKSRRSVQIDYHHGWAAAGIQVRQNGRVSMGAAFECESRHISYSDSDVVRAFVAEGYVLKAKVVADEHMVYIEQVNEDGSVAAYEVNPLKLSENTENPIEQIAAEAWQKTRDILNGGVFTEWNPNEDGQEEETAKFLTFEEMLQEFHEFVEKRIKDGPPKIQIGGSEFSEKEWEQLLKKIDKFIDEYKEELRERIRKRNGQKALAKEAGSAVETIGQSGESATKAGLAASGSEEREEPAILESEAKQGPVISENEAIKNSAISENGEKEDSAISEKEAIAGSAEYAQRGRDFLNRISGKRAPYSYLKDETGNITYNGVTFICDDKKRQICLGDMSNPKNVLTIPLSGGGSLRVNRDNLSELSKAIDMFSAEDVGRILRAIAQDSKAREMELEIKKTSLPEAF